MATNGKQATTAGSVGKKDDLSKHYVQVKTERKAAGDEILAIEQDHFLPSIITVPAGMRQPSGSPHQASVWSLSKSAHRLKTNASKDKIFRFDYAVDQLPLIEDYLDQVERNTGLHVINALPLEMLNEMGVSDSAELDKSLIFGMKRERAVIDLVVKRWGVEKDQAFPVLFAKRVVGIIEKESRGSLQWGNEIKPLENNYASIEEELMSSDVNHEKRVQSRFNSYQSYMREHRTNFAALQSPYLSNTPAYQHMQGEISKIDDICRQTAYEAQLMYGVKLAEYELSLKSCVIKVPRMAGMRSSEEAMARLLTPHQFKDLTSDLRIASRCTAWFW